jgi:hypothetical protein
VGWSALGGRVGRSSLMSWVSKCGSSQPHCTTSTAGVDVPVVVFAACAQTETACRKEKIL